MIHSTMVNHYVDDRSLRFRTATTITVILVILTSRVAFPTTTVRSRLKLTRTAIEGLNGGEIGTVSASILLYIVIRVPVTLPLTL